MARNIKDGIKVFYMDPLCSYWSVWYLRHLDQTMMSEIMTRLRMGEYETVRRPYWDALPEVIVDELSDGFDVYLMHVMDRDFYLVDPCKDLETIIRRMSICTRIYDERSRQGITQERLAKLSGIHKKSISQIERGLWSPTIDVMIKLGTALGIELKYV